MSKLPTDGLWAVVKKLGTDYRDYGGNIERWKSVDISYPDCSWGCDFFAPLYDYKHDDADCDWGVCSNPESPRAGLLTWEHQAGFKCFKCNK